MTRIIALLVVVWLVLGALAAFQRDYFDDNKTNCAEASNIGLTIVAGPLNYLGVNPKVDCADIKVPQPSE